MNTIIQLLDAQNDIEDSSKSANKIMLPNQADIETLAALNRQMNAPIAPDAIGTESLQDLYNQKTPTPEAAVQTKPLGRDSSLLFVLDNRIVPEQVGFRDKVNPNIWLHPRDISDPKREQALREKLQPITSLPYPSYHDGDVRKPFIDAIRNILTKNPQLDDSPPQNPFPKPILTSAFNAPLSHIVNGQPFPELLTEAEQGLYSDANAIFLLLEYKLASKNKADPNVGGYPDLLKDTMQNLNNRGITQPSIDQLIHGLNDALGITTTQFVRIAADRGVHGVAELLNIDPPLVNEVLQLMDYSKNRSFPLNDVLNWEYGRKIAPPNSDIAHIIDMGHQERITQMIAAYKATIEDLGAVPNQLNNEMQLAAATELVPPLLRELFFQVGGQFIITQEPDLYNVINQPATGFNLSYQSQEQINQSLNQIFISGDLGLPRTNRTVVHEMHHTLFPQHISPEEAIKADNLLNRDEVRLNIFHELAKQYSDAQVRGDVVEQQKILDTLDAPEYAVNGVRFSEMLAGTPVSVFLGAVNEAFQYLQMESPSYNRIGAYQNADARWREIIPRYAELCFVEYVDRPQIIDFIAPNISKLYDEIYMPHLQERLDYVYANQPIKADALINSSINSLENNFNLPSANKPEIAPWVETLDGGITIEHPAGDVKPVSFVGLGTTHPSVQNYQQDEIPTAEINPQQAQRQSMAVEPAAIARN